MVNYLCIALGIIILFTVAATCCKNQISDMLTTYKDGIPKSEINTFQRLNYAFVIGIVVIVCATIGTTAAVSEKIKELQKDTTVISEEKIDICLNRLETVDKTKLLIDAIAYVESRDNEKCPGGGAMQITKICVDAANQFQSKVHYDYEDRYSREKSVEIWHIIQNNCNKTGDIEKAIRLWNGGPRYTKAGTQDYYEKVMKRYNYLIDQELEKICRQYKSLSLK